MRRRPGGGKRCSVNTYRTLRTPGGVSQWSQLPSCTMLQEGAAGEHALPSGQSHRAGVEEVTESGWDSLAGGLFQIPNEGKYGG